jgi:geranylgeranyl diphosphate synthase, type II
MTTQVLPEKKKHTRSQFFHFRDRIEQEIAGSISLFGEKTKLRDAVEYALTNGGKRFRPLIVLMVTEALGNDLPVSSAALSVEFFHTASLIADDLPCMDNDEERRDKPSLHKVYGETIALLASYALITAAFEMIHKNVVSLKEIAHPCSQNADYIGSLALENAAKCSGILGATGGQFLDLFPPILSLDGVKQVIYKKTVTLFEVSFVFGWMFGGGDLTKLEKVKQLAYHLGMAFQIADDLGDIAQDEKKQKEISMVHFVGKERAFAIFTEEMNLFEKKLLELDICSPSFLKMKDMLCLQAAQVYGIKE